MCFTCPKCGDKYPDEACMTCLNFGVQEEFCAECDKEDHEENHAFFHQLAAESAEGEDANDEHCISCGEDFVHCSCDAWAAQWALINEDEEDMSKKNKHYSSYTPGVSPAAGPNSAAAQCSLPGLPAGKHGKKDDHKEDAKGDCKFKCKSHFERGFMSGDGTWRQYDDTPLYAAGYVAKKSCFHAAQPFKVNGIELYITARRDAAKSPMPELGIYFDVGWKDYVEPKVYKVPVVHGYGGVSLDLSDIEDKADPDDGRWPALLVGWPDRGAINLEACKRLITFTWEHMQAGEKVEVGCYGAHGRTGTFLAMMLEAMEGLDPEAAIKAVWDRHCDEAIESEEQVDAIFQFAGKEATKEQKKELHA